MCTFPKVPGSDFVDHRGKIKAQRNLFLKKHESCEVLHRYGIHIHPGIRK